MLINYTLVPKCLILIAFFSLTSACNFEEKSTQQTCTGTANDCLELMKNDVKITFKTSHIIVENSYRFEITSEHQITDIFIEGVNMSMGKIPLQIAVVEGSQYNYKGQLMLGMCSERDMQWQFVIEKKQGKIITIPFTSSWPGPKG